MVEGILGDRSMGSAGEGWSSMITPMGNYGRGAGSSNGDGDDRRWQA